MTDKVTLRQEIEGIIASLESAWNADNLRDTINTMLDEDWIETAPKTGELIFLPAHLDLMSGKTLQVLVPLEYDPDGATMFKSDDLVDVLVNAGEALEDQDEYAMMSVQVNNDGKWEGIFQEGVEDLDE